MELKTLGQFYKKRVLSLPKKARKTVEFDGYSDDITLEEDLFGWKLHSGRHVMDCSSGEEARYLKVFFSANMRDLDVPKDNEYLKKVLPELEKIKKRIDDIIEDSLEYVLSRKIRDKVRHEVYIELTKY